MVFGVPKGLINLGYPLFPLAVWYTVQSNIPRTGGSESYDTWARGASESNLIFGFKNDVP
jgi:hypothetical protein